MFAISNGELLPVIVVDGKGKEKQAVLVKLVIDKPKKDEAVISQVVVQLQTK